MGYDFRVEFKPGVSNIVADALSRRDEENSAVCNALSVPVFSFFDTLRQLPQQDGRAAGVRQQTWLKESQTVYNPAASPTDRYGRFG